MTRGYWNLTVKVVDKPWFIGRWFGRKPETSLSYFRGSRGVWHHYPEGTRCSYGLMVLLSKLHRRRNWRESGALDRRAEGGIMDSVDIERFKTSYHDMISRLDKATEIASTFFGRQWHWTGDFDIEGDMIEVELTAYYQGGADTEHVSFPFEWLWTGGPDDDLSVTFKKGREYQLAVRANNNAEVETKRKANAESRERAQLARLQEKYG